jgi:hypothetical protein
VPGWQVPFDEALQQAPLHGCVDEQAVVQAWVVVLQELPLEQSPTTPQPHEPPPELPMQAVPMLLPAQLTQPPPVPPQAAWLRPVVHTPPWQQPVLQAVRPVAPHDGVHRCVLVLQA